ncbi:MAG: dynamin family protein [Chloroflexi bacterium]|nr:dynamin family protein [Chloroflexota bacterium]
MNKEQAEILRRERILVQDLLSTLESWQIQPEDREILREALLQLDEFFLLVVVGEFNSGKSALINALLRDRFLEEGVTPTTTQIHILKHGERGGWSLRNGEVIHTHPAEFLRQLNIVDTPGTNTVLQRHEVVTRRFVPRSDLVLFVTSADRPFTESERVFLEQIRSWGKKIVFVINKVDILASDEEVDEVSTFVREQAQTLLGIVPEIFPLSAKWVLEAGGERAPSRSRFAAFEEYIFKTLTQDSRIRLKFLNPLGVGQKIGQTYLRLAQEQQRVLEADLTVLSEMEGRLEEYQREASREAEYHLLQVDQVLHEMRARGEDYFDRTLRLTRFFELLNARLLREGFEREVVAEVPQQIERRVRQAIDGMMDAEFKRWRQMLGELERVSTPALRGTVRAGSEFEGERRRRIEGLFGAAQEVVARYDKHAEAQELVDLVQGALAQTALVEVSALGVGAVLKAILATTAADLTGLLAAGVVGVLGLFVLPYQRMRAKAKLRDKTEDLRRQLRRVLGGEFQHELERSLERMQRTLKPFAESTRKEHDRLQSVSESLAKTLRELDQLRARLGEE